MKIDEKISILEAILFSVGEPIDSEKLEESIQADKETLDKLAELLNERYKNCGSALCVYQLGSSYQLGTKEEYAQYIKKAMETKNNAKLSQAAFEVLTIIAYNQPVTKGFVEHVRGVDSSGVVNSLIEKGLLEEAGRIDVPGRPIAFKTTSNFLRCFKLKSLDDLPALPNQEQQITLEDLEVKEDNNMEDSD